jgi:hypothetical protein
MTNPSHSQQQRIAAQKGETMSYKYQCALCDFEAEDRELFSHFYGAHPEEFNKRCRRPEGTKVQAITRAPNPTRGETMSEQTEPVQVTRQCAKCGAYEESGGVNKGQCVNCGAWLPASPVAPATDYKRLATMLYRSLDRLSLAIESCAKIGFEESKPTTNAAHGAIWDDLNAAQKDAKLKLLHYQKFVAPVAPASAVKGICPACGEAIELSLAPSPVATGETAQHLELFDAIQKVVAWEEEYRTLNHLGKVPPHPFIRLALLAAQLINVQHVPKTTAREFVAAYWRHRCGYEPASKFIPDAASIQDQIAIAEAALLTGAAQPVGTPDKGEGEPSERGEWDELVAERERASFERGRRAMVQEITQVCDEPSPTHYSDYIRGAQWVKSKISSLAPTAPAPSRESLEDTK